MKQKQAQLQQLRENLLGLIEENPDSPEAEKWKHMLAQIGMCPSHPKALIFFYLPCGWPGANSHTSLLMEWPFPLRGHLKKKNVTNINKVICRRFIIKRFAFTHLTRSVQFHGLKRFEKSTAESNHVKSAGDLAGYVLQISFTQFAGEVHVICADLAHIFNSWVNMNIKYSRIEPHQRISGLCHVATNKGTFASKGIAQTQVI